MTVPEWKDANTQIAELWRQYPEGSSQLVLEARENPRQTHILARGDFLKLLFRLDATKAVEFAGVDEHAVFR